MPARSQKQFIVNWNLVAAKLSNINGFKKLPRLPYGLFDGGACAGFSFTLAEYVRRQEAERFYKLYNLVCDLSPSALARGIQLTEELRILCNKMSTIPTQDFLDLTQEIAKKDQELKQLESNVSRKEFHEIIDLIYKINIFQEQQQQVQALLSRDDLKKESADERAYREWLQFKGNAGNHERLGNPFAIKNIHVGELIQEAEGNFAIELRIAIQKIKNDESLEIGINDRSWGHSILLYRYNDNYYIFDSNVGEAVCVNTVDDAAKEVIFATNNCITLGTGKFTLLDRLWQFSRLLTIALAILFAPICFMLLIYDLFFAKPESKETLYTKPLSDTVWFSWGKISCPIVARENSYNYVASNEYLAETITNQDMIAIFNLSKEYSANQYSGWGWFNRREQNDLGHNAVYKAMQNAGSEVDRFNVAKNYLAKNSNTLFAKAIKDSIPALNSVKASIAPALPL